MPILRIVRRSRWLKERPSWLENDEFQADPLGDFTTTSNTISVWYIKENTSNLQRVVAALAAQRDRLVNFDYALFNKEILSELNIKTKDTKGETPDEVVNAWHYDLIEISAQKLLRLVQLVLDNAEIKRINWKEIRNWIDQSIESGQLDEEKIQLKEYKVS